MYAYNAIYTKYLGPTITRGSRIKARTYDGHSVTIGYPHHLNALEAHQMAAETLIRKMGWTGTYHVGGLDNGYVFVQAGENTSFTID